MKNAKLAYGLVTIICILEHIHTNIFLDTSTHSYFYKTK